MAAGRGVESWHAKYRMIPTGEKQEDLTRPCITRMSMLSMPCPKPERALYMCALHQLSLAMLCRNLLGTPDLQLHSTTRIRKLSWDLANDNRISSRVDARQLADHQITEWT